MCAYYFAHFVWLCAARFRVLCMCCFSFHFNYLTWKWTGARAQQHRTVLHFWQSVEKLKHANETTEPKKKTTKPKISVCLLCCAQFNKSAKILFDNWMRMKCVRCKQTITTKCSRFGNTDFTSLERQFVNSICDYVSMHHFYFVYFICCSIGFSSLSNNSPIVFFFFWLHMTRIGMPSVYFAATTTTIIKTNKLKCNVCIKCALRFLLCAAWKIWTHFDPIKTSNVWKTKDIHKNKTHPTIIITPITLY